MKIDFTSETVELDTIMLKGKVNLEVVEYISKELLLDKHNADKVMDNARRFVLAGISSRMYAPITQSMVNSANDVLRLGHKIGDYALYNELCGVAMKMNVLVNEIRSGQLLYEYINHSR